MSPVPRGSNCRRFFTGRISNGGIFVTVLVKLPFNLAAGVGDITGAR